MLWECEHCGSKGIAASLEYCPVCRKEKDLPKVTSGGASNAWEPRPEPTDEAPEAPESDSGDASAVPDPDPVGPEGSEAPEEPSTEQVAQDPQKKSGADLMTAAHEAYGAKDYDTASRLVDDALAADPSLEGQATAARKAIADAKGWQG